MHMQLYSKIEIGQLLWQILTRDSMHSTTNYVQRIVVYSMATQLSEVIEYVVVVPSNNIQHISIIIINDAIPLLYSSMYIVVLSFPVWVFNLRSLFFFAVLFSLYSIVCHHIYIYIYIHTYYGVLLNNNTVVLQFLSQ